MSSFTPITFELVYKVARSIATTYPHIIHVCSSQSSEKINIYISTVEPQYFKLSGETEKSLR